MIPVFLMDGIHEPHDTNQWYEACFFIYPKSENPVETRLYRAWLVCDVLRPFVCDINKKYRAKIPVDAFRQNHVRSGWNDGGLVEQWDVPNSSVSDVEFTLSKYDGTSGNSRGVIFAMPKSADELPKMRFIIEEFRCYLDGQAKRLFYESATDLDEVALHAI